MSFAKFLLQLFKSSLSDLMVIHNIWHMAHDSVAHDSVIAVTMAP